jgi:hypothetical protein
MKCHHHLDRDAIGICMACERGVCTECANDMERALACTGRCEPEVRRLLDMRDWGFAQPSRQVKILSYTQSNMRRSGAFLMVVGICVIVLGFWTNKVQTFAALGGVPFVFGALNYLKSRIPGDDRHFRLCPYCGYNVTGNTTGKCPECDHFV